MKLFNKRLIALDLTGADKQRPGQGYGYIPEIARLIKAELRKRGPHAKAIQVVIDYVGAMAKQHMAAENIDLGQLRHYIGNAPILSRNMLANEFDCPVWLIHQLSAQANKKGSGATFDYTDAAECGSFAENLDFCLVIGKPTLAGLCQLANTKHRRTGGTSAKIVQIKGHLNKVIWQPNKVVDPISHSIQDAQTVSVGSVVPPKKKPKTVRAAQRGVVGQ